MRVWTFTLLLALLAAQSPERDSAKVILLVCNVHEDTVPTRGPNFDVILRIDPAQHAVSIRSGPYQSATFGDISIKWTYRPIQGMIVNYVLDRPDLMLHEYDMTYPFSEFSGICHKSDNQI